MEIKVLNSLPGTGKTEAAINYIKESGNEKIIFITPFLDECQRVLTKCPEKNFYSPSSENGTKRESFNTLVLEEVNIVATQSLFKKFDRNTANILRDKGYTLIFDEVMSIVNVDSRFMEKDFELLQNLGLIKIKGRSVEWTGGDVTGTSFESLYNLIRSGDMGKVETIGNNALGWAFPIDVFKAFSKVYVLTYMFEVQPLRYYFDVNHLEYSYIGVKKDDDRGYVFTDEPVESDIGKDLINKVHIYDKFMNDIGKKTYALSASWYDKPYRNAHNTEVKKLMSHIGSYFKTNQKSPVDKSMWTVYKEKKSKFTPPGYAASFVPCNCRASNQYMNRNTLVYAVNIFMNPYVRRYFEERGCKVNEDGYALSEMIQWIWRSAIRKGDDIWIYVPSIRMRTLLQKWLERLSKGEPAWDDNILPVYFDEKTIKTKQERNDLMKYFNSLSKFKPYKTIPGYDYVSIEQIADYYETDVDAVRAAILYLTREISGEDFLIVQQKDFYFKVDGAYSKGVLIIYEDGDVTIKVKQNGIKLYYPTVLFRIGMVLDCPIAAWMRYYILRKDGKNDTKSQPEFDIREDTYEDYEEIGEGQILEIDEDTGEVWES